MTDSPHDSFFHTTCWSIVHAAAGQESGVRDSAKERAFEELCQRYWRPLYGFIRRTGVGEHDAQDLTQAFFVHVLKKPLVQSADKSRGRFRTFLLASLKNFLSNERDRQNTIRRGGRWARVALDFSTAEQWFESLPADESTPDRSFERSWALGVMDQVLERLRADHEKAGKLELFRALRPHLTADSQRLPYQQTAESLGMTADTVKVAVHRLRRKYRRILEETIGETVATPDEIADEIEYLLAALR